MMKVNLEARQSEHFHASKVVYLELQATTRVCSQALTTFSFFPTRNGIDERHGQHESTASREKAQSRFVQPSGTNENERTSTRCLIKTPATGGGVAACEAETDCSSHSHFDSRSGKSFFLPERPFAYYSMELTIVTFLFGAQSLFSVCICH